MGRKFITLVDKYNPAKKAIRMSWNPENLHAIMKKRLPLEHMEKNRSLFQQRWTAKRLIREYHFPNITQRQFIDRHFTANISLQNLTAEERNRVPPVAALGFAKLEKRLDYVVFRSHLAPSIFYARKIVGRGFVKVNGEVCNVPCRELEDGDLVTVDPSKVVTLKKDSDGNYKFNYVKYMAPHMHIPEYLEVNYPTCSTVLLRSPLPQPDRVEIPSPFPVHLHQKAFEWYSSTKRRKTKITDYEPSIVNDLVVKLKPKFARMAKADNLRYECERRGQVYQSPVIKKPIVKRRKVKVPKLTRKKKNKM